jgi:hypothetical protein
MSVILKPYLIQQLVISINEHEYQPWGDEDDDGSVGNPLFVGFNKVEIADIDNMSINLMYDIGRLLGLRRYKRDNETFHIKIFLKKEPEDTKYKIHLLEDEVLFDETYINMEVVPYFPDGIIGACNFKVSFNNNQL